MKIAQHLLLLSILCYNHTFANQGVDKESIRFRQIAAIEGNAKYLGLQMGLGIKAAFDGIIIHGRQIILEQANDEYEDLPAEALILDTIKKNDVLGVIGAVGTPTAKVMVPHAENNKLPFIGAFTGAELLRGDKRYIINLRASYIQESDELIDLSVKACKKKVAILMQRDSFGEAVLKGVSLSLSKYDLEIQSFSTFERNTSNVENGLTEALKTNPETLIIVGPYEPVAAAIRLIRNDKRYEASKNVTIMTVSFVGSDALAKELGPDADGVVISQVVPNPDINDAKIQMEFNDAINKFCKNSENKPLCGEDPTNWVAMEGYLVGRMVIDALKSIKDGEINRENLVDSLKKLEETSDNWKIKFDETLQGTKIVKNQASNYVITSIIKVQKDGSYIFEIIDHL